MILIRLGLLGMCDELPFGCISHKDQALHASMILTQNI
jgi:hypothetical protein